MIRKAKWLFFDVGSTIVDETLVWNIRVNETVAQKGAPSAELFYQSMINYARENKDPYKEALREYNLQKTSWHNEYECLYQEVLDVFKKIHRYYKIGIIANQNLGVELRLHDLGLLEYIDLVISSSKEGVAKPNLLIFEIALERAKCYPFDAIMIGDRLDNDIIPAKIIGMKTIWVKQGFGGMGNPTSLSNTPDHVIYRLEELISLLL